MFLAKIISQILVMQVFKHNYNVSESVHDHSIIDNINNLSLISSYIGGNCN